MSTAPAAGRALALDLGARRIGVAVSDPLRVIAHPWLTIARRSRHADLERIADLVREVEATVVVVGLPLLPSGDRGDAARRAEAFAGELRSRVAVPVVMWDESYTTEAATARRAARGVSRSDNARGAGIDAEAAAVILEEWLAATGDLATREHEEGVHAIER